MGGGQGVKDFGREANEKIKNKYFLVLSLLLLSFKMLLLLFLLCLKKPVLIIFQSL